ncbi:MAG TPA: hypothetical protein VF631_14925 [Allosphingosinicella sp.]|jgi:hypothetical protein|uniref:hypothetical protein n=1 Tax=Allosphingosinicella sp. TaxID=2823234 RepID=UPI002F29BFA4
MKNKQWLAAAAALGGVATAAGGQQAPAVGGADCELHVWPAGDLKAVTQGWVFNHTLNQAFDLAKGGTAKPAVLAPERQVTLLQAMDLPMALKLPPQTRVVMHSEPLPRSREGAKERQSPSSSPCYSELVVSQIFYDDAPMARGGLKTLALYRVFADAPLLRTSFATWTETELSTFPAKSAAEARAADEELILAYRSNLRGFAGHALAPPKKKGRKN